MIFGGYLIFQRVKINASHVGRERIKYYLHARRRPQQPPYGLGFDWDRRLKFVIWGGYRGPTVAFFVIGVPYFGFCSLWGGRAEMLLYSLPPTMKVV
jgi:hypothetical protein